MRDVVAAAIIGGLAVAVAVLGARPLPAELSPLRPTWVFTETAGSWTSTNSRVVRTSQGLVVTPTGSPAMISSGPMEHDPAAFERMRLRLRAGETTQGRVGIVLRGNDGTVRVLASFDVPGGDAFANVVALLPRAPAGHARVAEAVLVPSIAVQPTVVASIRFEPDDPWLVTTARELWSPSPGEAMARLGFSMHSIPPPVLNARSAWAVLTPLVLFAGILARFATGKSGVWSLVRRSAWAAVGAAWGIGFVLLFYHQAVALAVDLRRFGDLGRNEAYTLVDGVPLWTDMHEVARRLPEGSMVDFITEAGEDPVVSALWTGRAAYYLYPIQVRPGAAAKIRYFGGLHRPCAQIAPDMAVLQEADRYCLFKAGA